MLSLNEDLAYINLSGQSLELELERDALHFIHLLKHGRQRVLFRF